MQVVLSDKFKPALLAQRTKSLTFNFTIQLNQNLYTIPSVLLFDFSILIKIINRKFKLRKFVLVLYALILHL